MISANIKTIWQRELKYYFSTPMGYIFLVIFLFAIGYVTFEPGRGNFFLARQADLSAFFNYIPWPFLFLIPAVAMRIWAEERKNGTIELLLTMPITLLEAVFGKFVAAFSFLIISLLGTFPMIITVFYLGSPDFFVIVNGYFSAILLAGTMLSVATFFSAISKNQVVSFILGAVVCYLFLMAGSPPILQFLSGIFPRYFIDVFESLSLLNHYESMIKGVINFGDVFYFLAMIIGWNMATILLLKNKKAQ